MHDRYRFLFTIACLLGLLVSAAMATETVFQPGPEAGQDSWVMSSDPTAVNGGLGYLYFGGSGGSEVRLYIKFDVSTLSPGTEITEAELQFYQFANNGLVDGFTYGAYAVTGAWSQATLTWSNQPTFAEEPTTTFPGLPWQGSGAWNQWHAITGLASLVQQWVDDPSSNHGVVIRPVGSFYGHVSLWSSNYSNGALRPKLVVQSENVPAESRTWSGVKSLFR